MKKGFHILFGIVFLALTMGVTINKHYSAGKLYAVSIFGQPESCCDIPCDCCDDETHTYKITGEYLFSSNIIIDNELKAQGFQALDAISDMHSIYLSGYFKCQYRKDIHPPRKLSDSLSEIQSYLM